MVPQIFNEEDHYFAKLMETFAVAVKFALTRQEFPLSLQPETVPILEPARGVNVRLKFAHAG